MAAYVLRSASKLLLGARAAVTALYDPTRADMVAALGETTGELVLSRIRDKMLLDPTGRRILRERPLISSQSLDLERLRNLPANTFGRSYIAFLDKHNVTPDSRDEVKYIEDEELAYVMLRYRQSGANAKHLMSVMYEDMFELEHDHVLKKLGIERMPPLDNPTTMQPPQADVVEKH
ncbi:hypothetical protein BASA83_000431 [Batrachochytrium salamandrivorans]|nr:hypothetical protein BASA83_000431 [Batrachochytrium salamandrivorans]